MDAPPRIPTALRVVAILFILSGAWAILEILVSLTHSRLSFNFGVLGLFIGPGLLALKPGWRTCALVFIWFALIVIPIIALFMLGYSGPINVELFGQKIGHVPKPLGLLVALLTFLLAYWQYRVLTRPDIRPLFGLK